MKLTSQIKALAEQTEHKAVVGYKYGELKVMGDVSKIEIGQTIKLSGYLSTFNSTDRVNDTVLPGAFTRTLANRLTRFPLLLDHEQETSDQCGSFTAIQDEVGLLIDADFLVTEETIHQARLIVAGHLVTMSMGGIFFYDDLLDEFNRNVIRTVELYEGSIVVIPANQEAIFTVVKENAQVGSPPKDEQVSCTKERVKEILKQRRLKNVRKN